MPAQKVIYQILVYRILRMDLEIKFAHFPQKVILTPQKVISTP